MKKGVFLLVFLLLGFNFVFASGSGKCEQDIYPNIGKMGATYWENQYDQSLRDIDDGKTYNKIGNAFDSIKKKFSKKTVDNQLKIYKKFYSKLNVFERKKFFNKKIDKNKKLFYTLKVLEVKVKLEIINLKIKKCEGSSDNQNFISNNGIKCIKNNLEIDGEINKIIFSEDGTQKLVFFQKGRWGKCDDCMGGEEFYGVNYIYYYKNGDLLKTFENKSGGLVGGFIDGNYYVEKFYGNLKGLEFLGNKYYGYKGIKKLNNNFSLRKNNREKVLFSDGSLSKEYDVIFDVKILENSKKILLVGRGKYKLGTGMGEESKFLGKYFLVKNGIEIELKNVKNPEYGMGVKKIVSCNGKFGYIYYGNEGAEFLSFSGKNYGKNGFKIFNFYGFKKETCEPLYILIDDLSLDKETSELYIGDELIKSNIGNIGEPKIVGEDIYYKLFEGKLSYGGGYKLYKNSLKIENRGWVTKFGFIDDNKLIYTTRIDGGTYIVYGNSEKFLAGIKGTDDFKISKNKKNYAFNFRGKKNLLYLNGKLIFRPYDFRDGMFIKNDFISVYIDSKNNKNYLYKNNKKIFNFNGNGNIVIPNNNVGKDKINLFIKTKFNNLILKCE